MSRPGSGDQNCLWCLASMKGEGAEMAVLSSADAVRSAGNGRLKQFETSCSVRLGKNG